MTHWLDLIRQALIKALFLALSKLMGECKLQSLKSYLTGIHIGLQYIGKYYTIESMNEHHRKSRFSIPIDHYKNFQKNATLLTQILEKLPGKIMAC